MMAIYREMDDAVLNIMSGWHRPSCTRFCDIFQKAGTMIVNYPMIDKNRNPYYTTVKW